MRSLKTLVLACAVMALAISGCKKGDDAAAKKADTKSDCQKAVDNLLALAKSDDSEMGKMMAKQNPDVAVKECDMDEKKHPGGAKCGAEAKSIADFMKCGAKARGGDDKAEPTEEKVEGKGEEKAPEEKPAE